MPRNLTDLTHPERPVQYPKPTILPLFALKLVEWVEKGLSFRRLPAKRGEIIVKPFIPEKLPPIEIPGVIFRGPIRQVVAPSELSSL